MEQLKSKICKHYGVDTSYYNHPYPSRKYRGGIDLNSNGLILVETVTGPSGHCDYSFEDHPDLSASNYSESDIIEQEKSEFQSLQTLRIPDCFRKEFNTLLVSGEIE